MVAKPNLRHRSQHTDVPVKVTKIHQVNASRKPISLEGFVTHRSTPYETEWPASLDPRLRQAVQRSAVTIPIGLLTTLWAPTGANFARSSDYFLILQECYIGWMHGLMTLSPLIIIASLASAVGGYCLWDKTHGMRTGNLLWQRIALAIAIFGALSALAVGAPLLMLAINLLLWALIIVFEIVLGVVIVIVALSVLAGLGASR